MLGARKGRWMLIGLLLAAGALALSVLGGGAVAGAQPKATASSTVSVDIANFKFHPPTLHIKVGTKVTFTNEESNVTHTATANAGSFDTGKIAPGKSMVVKFSHKGTFSYHCSIHPYMHAKIIVE